MKNIFTSLVREKSAEPDALVHEYDCSKKIVDFFCSVPKNFQFF